MSNRPAALLLAFALLLMLAACGGSTVQRNSSEAAEPAQQSEGAESTDVEATEETPAEAEEGAVQEEPAGEGFQLQEGEWYTPGEGADADGRGLDELEENEVPDEEQEGQMLSQGITEEEYAAFGVTVPDAAEKARGFRDFDETLHSSFLGTWYDPEAGEALRITEDGAYVYIPYLGLWGEKLCRWELVDRSERGKVPMLAIYCFGEDGGPLAYYVAGNTGTYFWCVSQGQLFYRQD